MNNLTTKRITAILAAFTIAGISSVFAADAITIAGTWKLSESQVGYKVNHPMKTAVATSKRSKGKGRCAAACEFLIATPVASFDSGDSNRDLHMLETTKGAKFPVIMVRSNFKPGALQGNKLTVELEIEFAGVKSTVPGVELTLSQREKNTLQVDGTFKIKLTSHGIVKPSLLGMSVDDDVPITVRSVWLSE